MDISNKARSFLAAMGAEHSFIDKSFQGDYKYGDSTGNRTSALTTLDKADEMMRKRLWPDQYNYQEPVELNTGINYKNIMQQLPTFNQHSFQNNHRNTREERINKLLGKASVKNDAHSVDNIQNAQLVIAFKEALEPVLEQLEDIAVLNGILVQRIEKLINVVEPEVNFDGPYTSIEQQTEPFFQDDIPLDENIEVYDPKISMSVTEDSETQIDSKNKKKKTT